MDLKENYTNQTLAQLEKHHAKMTSLNVATEILNDVIMEEFLKLRCDPSYLLHCQERIESMADMVLNAVITQNAEITAMVDTYAKGGRQSA